MNMLLSRLSRLGLIILIFIPTGCAFNFDVTSQRTALENQVMGTYKELEDELVLSAAVRGGDVADGSSKKALVAKQNQMFNEDEIRELKNAGLLGEGSDGYVKRIGKRNQEIEIPKFLLDSIDQLSRSENSDREVIWRHIIAENKNLSAKDLANIGKSYAKILQDKALAGHWLQDGQGNWTRKK